MRERINNIMNQLKADSGWCQDFTVKYDDEEHGLIFDIETVYSNYGHQTWLEFRVTGEMIRVIITHVFGTLHTDHRGSLSNLVDVLKANQKAGYHAAASYIAVMDIEDTLFVSLQGYSRFLAKWNDEDIALAISIQLTDFINALAIGPWPEAIQLWETPIQSSDA